MDMGRSESATEQRRVNRPVHLSLFVGPGRLFKELGKMFDGTGWKWLGRW
jgi:hypothetical protein